MSRLRVNRSYVSNAGSDAAEDLAAGTVNGNLAVTGDFQVDGTTTTVSSTTVTVDDKNIELGATDSPSDSTADGGGITLKGTTDKTISWENDDNKWHFNQGITVNDSTTGSAHTGGSVRLSADDGAPMGDSHRLGAIEFSGAEDGSGTQVVGARIEALTDAAWTNVENGTAMYFYTTDGDASQHNVLKLDSNEKATFSGNVDISGGLQFDGGTAVTSIDTDLSSVSGSDDTLASAKAIKAYVDSEVSGGGGGAVASVANGADNRLASFTSSDDLNGEANLQFDGTDGTIAAAGKWQFRDSGIYIQSDEDAHLSIVSDGHVTTKGFPSNENAIGTSGTSFPSLFAADGDCTGDIIKLLNDTTTKGHVYYLSDHPEWEEAQANDTNDGGPGDMLAIAVGTNSNTHGMLVKGLIRINSGNYDGVADADIGKIGYLSDDAAGQIDFTAPAGTGEVVRVLGHCLQKVSDGAGGHHILFYFNPSNDHVEIA